MHLGLGIVGGFFIGATLVAAHSVHPQVLVDRGLALYCPQDGHFAFVGECDE